MAANIQQHHQSNKRGLFRETKHFKKIPLNDFNMEPKNGGLEDTVPFQSSKVCVSFQGSISKKTSLYSDVENFVNGDIYNTPL